MSQHAHCPIPQVQKPLDRLNLPAVARKFRVNPWFTISIQNAAVCEMAARHISANTIAVPHIALDGQEALNALDLSLSTCDRGHVHYDFLCKNVRILQNDKAIGRSVTFRIGPIPVFWVPFFVFPVKRGRQSGLLTPGVGSNSRDGIFVHNLGYYFAPSEYWDATVKSTLRERGGFLLESRFAYTRRNRFSGSMDIGYDHDTSGDRTAHNWRFNLQHQQRLNATTNIRGSGQFSTSTNFDRRNSNNLYRYLNRQLRSSFFF